MSGDAGCGPHRFEPLDRVRGGPGPRRQPARGTRWSCTPGTLWKPGAPGGTGQSLPAGVLE
jgi:hypothetical protein